MTDFLRRIISYSREDIDKIIKSNHKPVKLKIIVRHVK